MGVILLYGTGPMQDAAVSLVVGALAVGFIAWIMTYQSKIDLLANVPCAFMGCFSTFAAGGDWKALLVGVTIGVVLGFVCDYSGRYFFRLWSKPETA